MRTVEVTRQALPHLLDAELADVVNLSSMSGRRVAGSSLGVYAGTKHAVHAIGQAMAMELHDTRVRVTTVAPGFVDTPIFADAPRAASYRRAVAEQGLTADEVAAEVVHVLAQPAHVRLVEIAMTSTLQAP